MVDSPAFKLRAAQPDFSLANRSALVTGGGTNIGFALAYALATAGASVTIVSRTEAKLAAAVDRLNALDSPATHSYLAADLTDDSAFDALTGRDFDIVVNNAGGGENDGPWQDQSADDWRAALELNVVAANRLCQLFVPGMIDRSWGRVINVASIFGVVAPDPRDRRPGFEGAAYTAAKHALIGLTKFLAVRLAPAGITANAISPGRFPLAVDDPARAARMDWTATQDMKDRWIEATPMRRTGDPRELGGAVVYLASEAASYVTGQNLIIDGGWVTS